MKKYETLNIYTPDSTTEADLPLSASGVSAGFPSPADDFMDLKLDLNRELIKNPASTFYARVSGVSIWSNRNNENRQHPPKRDVRYNYIR